MGLLLNLIKGIVFGIVQGITEWLPISDAGHMMMINSWMPFIITDPEKLAAFWQLFKVFLQFGCAAAVFVQFGNKLNPMATEDEKEKDRITRLWLMILIADLPSGILGLLLYKVLHTTLYTAVITAVTIMIIGAVLIFLPTSNTKQDSLNRITLPVALKTGLIGILSLLPGVSRAAGMLIGGSLSGMSRRTAVEFSVVSAGPWIIIGGIYRIFTAHAPFYASAIPVFIVGVIVSFVVSSMVISSLRTFVRRNSFKLFGYYRVVLGVLMLVLALMKVMPEVLLG
ncbi:MAG: undecaprenyl-diphosphate phosphatase [Solobacterium sp.]|nr:undecaprenyl-diphosphate phosphatase [Solobacterium sp.]